jgi:hypothetical protein
MLRSIFFTIPILLLTSACQKTQTAEAQRRATIQMADGTQVAGNVQSASATSITVAGDDGIVKTISMGQVKTIAYEDAAAPGGAPPTASPEQAATPSSAPPPAAVQDSAQDRAAHENHYHPPRTAIRTKTYHLPVGTEIPVRTEETIDSGKAVEGQTYAAEVARDVNDEQGDVVIPRGSNAQIVIRSASKGGRFRGAADLVLDLAAVSVEGQQYALSTADLSQRGKEGVGANRRTAEYSGGGAVVGAIIGAIAGGGKGAAIGAGAGGGAGALTQVLTKGGAIRVPAETVLMFRLDNPLRVTAR